MDKVMLNQYVVAMHCRFTLIKGSGFVEVKA